MSRHCLEITTLHGFTIDELQHFANKAPSGFTRSMLLTVIMRYQGIHTNDIMKVLGKTRPTIVSYINKWNDSPFNLKDHRGNNVPTEFTSDIIEDIKHVLTCESPAAFGFEQNTWTCPLLAKYIELHYGRAFSTSWLSRILHSIGFSYKRGVYEPTKGNPQEKEGFKKNGFSFGDI